MCDTGRSGVPVTPNGSTEAAWLCTIAMMSGRAL